MIVMTKLILLIGVVYYVAKLITYYVVWVRAEKGGMWKWDELNAEGGE